MKENILIALVVILLVASSIVRLYHISREYNTIILEEGGHVVRTVNFTWT